MAVAGATAVVPIDIDCRSIGRSWLGFSSTSSSRPLRMGALAIAHRVSLRDSGRHRTAMTSSQREIDFLPSSDQCPGPILPSILLLLAIAMYLLHALIGALSMRMLETLLRILPLLELLMAMLPLRVQAAGVRAISWTGLGIFRGRSLM